MVYDFSDKIKELKPSAIREIFKHLSDPSIISFAGGNPSPESFPVKELAAISEDIFKNSPTSALQYSVTEGYPKLRIAVAKRLYEKFSIGKSEERGDAYSDETIIVSGGNQGLELACKVFCNEGDVVVCENPSFIGALNSFRSNGAKTVGVPLEDDGINIEELERTLEDTPNAKLLYIISTFQNPSGVTTSYEKRRAIYTLAKRYGVMILEDNPYGELRYFGEDIPTIKSMDTDGLVVYCSSFSKILSPGMRVGYVCAPDAVIQKMVVAKQSEDVHTNIFFQMLCYKFMSEYDIDAQVKKICDLYRKKCTLMLDCLDKYMPKEIKFTRPKGGLFIWCTLPANIDMMSFVRAALSEKVAVVAGTAFNCDTNAPSSSFRLNYSTPSDEQIVEGVKRLGALAEKMLKGN